MSAIKEVKMPDLGTAASQITLVSWLKDEGEAVKRGEPLCVVETDKAASELESIADGFLLRKVVAEGAVVETGQTIALIGRSDEATRETPVAAPDAKAPPAGPVGVGPPHESKVSPVAAEVKASPMIVNLARRSGVDLNRISGTGPGGQVTRSDVLRAKEGETGPHRSALSRNQVVVARTVSTRWREAVPISLSARIRMDNAMSFRERPDTGRRLAIDSLFVHGAALAMREFPNFRCFFEEEALVDVRGINVAVAVSGGTGLYLPVIRNADRQTLEEIDSQLSGLVALAAAGRLTREHLSGATFSVSNLGMLPIDSFTAVIPSGQAAILSVGAVRESMTYSRTDAPRLDRIATVVLTVDHRFINGKEAGEMLARIKEAVEAL
jgi:pyruvate dehydrogenase E2 component (dihydrolipoamide acetyltransferase)